MTAQPTDQPEKHVHAELQLLLSHVRRLEGVTKPMRAAAGPPPPATPAAEPAGG